ncbi:hypothetical protein PCYB_094860, partial [Plasmodium cynomolgi strain B]
MRSPLARTICALLYAVSLCKCFFPINGGEPIGSHRQGGHPSEGEKKMRSVLRKGSITHLCNKIRCVNYVQWYEGRRRISSATWNSGKRSPVSSRLFGSFETKIPGSQADLVVDGIAVSISDNTNIFKEETSSTPIVLIHGCYGSKNNFRVFSKSLKSSKIVTLDLRNHGNSKHTDSMKYEEMESDIKKVLDELHIRKCCLVGFSLGGKVSMYCALKNQSLFSHLVVMDILPFDYNEKKCHVKLPYNISYMTKILFNIKTKMRPRSKADFPLNHQERKYHNPCSFIIGKKSDLVYTMPQYQTIIKNYFPSSENFILPDATHTVYIDNAKECADIVNRTLRL